MTTPIRMAARLLLPDEVDRSGRALLAEASIVHAKTAQLAIHLEQTMTDLLDDDGIYGEGRRDPDKAAPDYLAQLLAYVDELRDLVDWIDPSFKIHSILGDVETFTRRMSVDAEVYARSAAAEPMPTIDDGLTPGDLSDMAAAPYRAARELPSQGLDRMNSPEHQAAHELDDIGRREAEHEGGKG